MKSFFLLRIPSFVFNLTQAAYFKLLTSRKEEEGEKEKKRKRRIETLGMS
jgi:hypothetical protein